MIKIKPYTELPLPNQDEAFRLYLSMAARALPFYPEDIFPDGYFYPDGFTKKPIAKFNRKTDLAKVLHAEKIIEQFSTELHSFLYFGAKGNGHVVPENLRTLLTTAVDDDSLVAAGLGDILKHSPDADKKVRKELLEYVFRYESFRSQKQIHHFVNLLGVDVCPYCNRQFITTLERKKGASPIRPELDHYRNKSLYPFLALSILNLIPSCPTCNHIKSDGKEPLLYPYKEDMGTNVYFRTLPVTGITYLTGGKVASKDFNLVFQHRPDTDGDLIAHSRQSINALRLSDLYSSHRDYISDLMLQRYIFTDDMITELRERFPILFHSDEEVRNMLLLTDINQDSWGKRPLTKLTHDISDELDELYKN